MGVWVLSGKRGQQGDPLRAKQRRARFEVALAYVATSRATSGSAPWVITRPRAGTRSEVSGRSRGARLETKGANGHGEQSGLGAPTTVVGNLGKVRTSS